MKFSDVIGQESVKSRLIEAVRQGRVPHAQLFCGPEGTAKLPLALAYAQYLACQNRGVDCCGTCPACLQYGKLEHPDLHFVFPIVRDKEKGIEVCDDVVRLFRKTVLQNPYLTESEWYEALGVERKQGLIYDSEASEVLRKLSLRAYGNGYRTVVIWLPERMNIQCANTLLKILEEPPAGTLFLLVSEHPEMLLPTIRSRVQEVVLDVDTSGVMLERKLEQDCNLWLEDFIAIMRNAYSISNFGQSEGDKAAKFRALKGMRDWAAKMASSDMGREKQKAFLQYAQRQVRENYIRNFMLPELNTQAADEARFSERFAPFINDNNVERIMAELDKAETQITQNGNAKIILFDLCLQMIMAMKKK